jgi:hypothetical protein
VFTVKVNAAKSLRPKLQGAYLHEILAPPRLSQQTTRNQLPPTSTITSQTNTYFQPQKMTMPQIRRPKKKLTVQLSGLNDIRLGTPANAPPSTPRAARPEPPKPSVADYTFEQYNAAKLSIDDQHSVIGKLRGELPLIDCDEVDNVLLRSMAQQLELCIFPTCKMMQVDPAAVKRMLDEQFRRSYGFEVEAEVLGKLGYCRLEDVVKAPAAEEKEGEVASPETKTATEKATQTEDNTQEELEDSGAFASQTRKVKTTPAEKETATEEVMGVANALMELKESVAAITTVAQPPPKKKMKPTPPNNTQKENKAHIARRKKGRHGVKMVTLKSEAVANKWEALNGGS